MVATIGWFINGRILKKNLMSSSQILIFDKLIPLLSKIEKKINIPFGLSMIAICRKE